MRARTSITAMTNSSSICTNRRGFTLPEVMLTVTILALIMPILAVVFTSANRGFTGFEAANSLKQANQNTVNRMYLRLGRNKRLFQNTTDDGKFAAGADLGGCSAPMSPSALPTIEENGTLAEGTTNFHSASFGNSLFFGYNDAAMDLENLSDGSTTGPLRVDLYKFAYYYLTKQDSPVILDRQTYKVAEWESIQYADCNEIRNVSNATKRSSLIKALANAGIKACWDTSATSYSAAFSSVTAGGTLTALASPTIAKGRCQQLTKVVTGIMGLSYRYGVSPNTLNWADARKTVPLYATPNGLFPSGLEVGIVGPAGGRKVFIRSVVDATSLSGGIIEDEQTVLSSARDIW